MKLISLTQGKFAKVDDADFSWLNQWKWIAYYDPKADRWYTVRRCQEVKPVRMHVEIGKRHGIRARIIDHQNRDSLDNRSQNIRAASRAKNSMNCRKHRRCKNFYKGVFWHEAAGKWMAQIRHRAASIYLGLFSDPKVAAGRYDEKARELFGAFACVNFPKEGERGCLEEATI